MRRITDEQLISWKDQCATWIWEELERARAREAMLEGAIKSIRDPDVKMRRCDMMLLAAKALEDK